MTRKPQPINTAWSLGPHVLYILDETIGCYVGERWVELGPAWRNNRDELDEVSLNQYKVKALALT
jgi:hypothetical protein